MNTFHHRFMTPTERIEQLLAPPNEQGCRLWLGRKVKSGNKDPNGYGTIKINGRHRLVTRVLWSLANGPIAPDLLICHRCDTPACCNLDHLFVGSAGDNNADMVRKGRQAKEHRKLNRSQALEILRLRFKERRSLYDIAAQFNVTVQAIHHIATGKNWKHLGREGV